MPKAAQGEKTCFFLQILICHSIVYELNIVLNKNYISNQIIDPNFWGWIELNLFRKKSKIQSLPYLVDGWLGGLNGHFMKGLRRPI